MSKHDLPIRLLNLLLFSASAFAQSGNAMLNGTVIDGTGALIPSAHVTVTNLATGVRRWILRGCMAVMLAALSAAMYEHNLGDGEVLTLFLTVCACGYRAIDSDTVEAKGA